MNSTTTPTAAALNTHHADAGAPPATGVLIVWGLVFGVVNAAAPLVLWWLTASAALALTLPLIAAIYIGFAVADGRPFVIAVETAVASVFLLLAATAVTGSPWLLVAAFVGHGVKDLWQQRHHFVRNTRWWPPFCATVDFLAAAILTVEIAAGVQFH
jgi:hypothetical protein